MYYIQVLLGKCFPRLIKHLRSHSSFTPSAVCYWQLVNTCGGGGGGGTCEIHYWGKGGEEGSAVGRSICAVQPKSTLYTLYCDSTPFSILQI